jgi:hypothetical protein
MSFAIWCLCLGAAAWIISYGLKGLFVDASDTKNPFRLLIRSFGYLGIVVGAYGALLLVIQAI